MFIIVLGFNAAVVKNMLYFYSWIQLHTNHASYEFQQYFQKGNFPLARNMEKSFCGSLGDPATSIFMITFILSVVDS